MSIDELEAEVAKLGRQDRARLAKKLLESLEPVMEGENDEVWVQEAERRDAEWDHTPSAGRPATDVLRDTRSRLR